MSSNFKTFRTLLIYPLILAVLTLSAGQAGAEAVFNKIVAFVNGSIITQYDVQEAVAPDLLKAGLSRTNPADADHVYAIEKRMLDAMITDELFSQEAERYKLTVKDAEVENEVRKLAQRSNMSLEQVKEQMRKDGVSYDMFFEKIRRSIVRTRLINFMVSRKVVVTKEDVQAYYEQHASEFSSERKATVKMLVFAPNADKAKTIAMIREGKLSFEDAVKMFSIGPAKDNGGLLGDLAWKDISADWRSALEPLSAGQVAEPFEQDGATILLKLDKATNGDLLPLEEVYSTIENTLRQPMLEARFGEYTTKLREKAVVKINL
ncbi:SurA N-terminal domain-containing protein [Desulfovibrio mangrovi]|uniref:peptidyl-prolyl cis-trans isomerase n=1 Tax=Desulfovibrio mangrovi TaxID=2976983 RepID=UPI002247D5A4|nr:peptidyl-prolyl cis-trans isomerase [Desulfovibrio mangrovi]UZP68367.1 SurA N-terminal domain-containing protein [Desulfovibrio mangrovi]